MASKRDLLTYYHNWLFVLMLVLPFLGGFAYGGGYGWPAVLVSAAAWCVVACLLFTSGVGINNDELDDEDRVRLLAAKKARRVGNARNLH